MARASGTDLGQAVEFGHDQGVAGEAATGVDAILGDAEFQAGLALGDQILPDDGPADVSDERCRHGRSVRIGPNLRNCYRTIHMKRCWCRFGEGRSDGLAVRWTLPLRTAPPLLG